MKEPTAPPNVKPTVPLAGEALAFWRRHYAELVRKKILTPRDLDTFTLLCLTWGKLTAIAATPPGAVFYRESIQFVNLNKQYQALAKQFGLMPRDRKAGKLEGESDERKDEFGL